MIKIFIKTLIDIDIYIYIFINKLYNYSIG
jgi:hypothetical protein